jgi:hypothetical protein
LPSCGQSLLDRYKLRAHHRRQGLRHLVIGRLSLLEGLDLPAQRRFAAGPGVTLARGTSESALTRGSHLRQVNSADVA